MSGFDKHINRRKLRKAYWLVSALAKRQELWRIVRHLAKQEEPVSVQVIWQRLGIEQSVVSFHLGFLRRYNLVDAERDGKYMLYQINKDQFERIANAIDKFGALEARRRHGRSPASESSTQAGASF